MRVRAFLALCVAAAAVWGVSSALADAPGPGSCSGGAIQGGTYNGFTVTGTCVFAGAPITINGDLQIAPGASLNAHDATSAVVHVTGNVIVGAGATLGLGQFGPPDIAQTGTVVDGNIVATAPMSLYLSAITIHGNLVSSGGNGPGLNFPIKNVVVDGNVVLQGWSGLWIGLFRSQVGGSVIFLNNTGTQLGDSGAPDSSEIADNMIGGNLICEGNNPPAQFGDSGGGPNSVAGVAIGECASLAR